MNKPEVSKIRFLVREVLEENLGNMEVVLKQLRSSIFCHKSAEEISERLLIMSLIIVDTEKGRNIFIATLEYVKTINPELANRFWLLFDSNTEGVGQLC